jgi:hypothetical protein
MLEIGFKCLISGNRKALCEQKHVVILRKTFLREYVRLMHSNENIQLSIYTKLRFSQKEVLNILGTTEVVNPLNTLDL